MRRSLRNLCKTQQEFPPQPTDVRKPKDIKQDGDVSSSDEPPETEQAAVEQEEQHAPTNPVPGDAGQEASAPANPHFDPMDVDYDPMEEPPDL
eukprot:4935571-Amphidinium_carterae.2